MSANQIKVTLVRSVIGSNEKVCATVRGLGLRKTNSSRVLENSPNVRGMIRKVHHLLKVEEVG
ncbi:MAG: 50S ribosomal protein L30 [SAR324 cluster bacterium]|jgi:large subunit ribosomal protein L30|nr:50S ribosomal protein L30 [SAR324 cluster bacterium]MEC8260262.1 50S ribosomal protein L30 [SAR324 cluster bacterium]